METDLERANDKIKERITKSRAEMLSLKTRFKTMRDSMEDIIISIDGIVEEIDLIVGGQPEKMKRIEIDRMEKNVKDLLSYIEVARMDPSLVKEMDRFMQEIYFLRKGYPELLYKYT